MSNKGQYRGNFGPYFDLPWPPLLTRSNFFGSKWTTLLQECHHELPPKCMVLQFLHLFSVFNKLSPLLFHFVDQLPLSFTKRVKFFLTSLSWSGHEYITDKRISLKFRNGWTLLLLFWYRISSIVKRSIYMELSKMKTNCWIQYRPMIIETLTESPNKELKLHRIYWIYQLQLQKKGVKFEGEKWGIGIQWWQRKKSRQ